MLLEALDVNMEYVVPQVIGHAVPDEETSRAIRRRAIGIAVGDGERQTAAHCTPHHRDEVRALPATLVSLPGAGRQ
jgi:hypothetical protein